MTPYNVLAVINPLTRYHAVCQNEWLYRQITNIHN